MAYSRCLIMKNKPRIRFKGFTEDWEQRKLSDILKVNSGKDYKHLDQGNIPVYGTGGYMLSVNESLSNIDAIGIGRKGTIDKPQYLKAPFWTVDTLFYLTALDHHSILFLYYLIQLIPWKKYDESTGVPSLSKTTIDNISGYVPLNSKEEELISTLFNQLDKSITLHQRKLEKLKLAKKALLQKFFPKNGSQFPEIRFKGFTDAWEQRKLGEIGKWYKGSGGTKDDLNTKHSGRMFVHYADLYQTSEFLTTVIHWTTNENIGSLITPNSILFPMSDVTPYGLARTTSCKINEVRAGGDVLINTIDKSIDSDFVSIYINLFSKNILPFVTGTTVKHINSKALSELTILIPSFEEQLKIVNAVNFYNKVITLHQRKLDKLQEVKKGLLQKMFI